MAGNASRRNFYFCDLWSESHLTIVDMHESSRRDMLTEETPGDPDRPPRRVAQSLGHIRHSARQRRIPRRPVYRLRAPLLKAPASTQGNVPFRHLAVGPGEPADFRQSFPPERRWPASHHCAHALNAQGDQARTGGVCLCRRSYGVSPSSSAGSVAPRGSLASDLAAAGAMSQSHPVVDRLDSEQNPRMAHVPRQEEQKK
jgi:hypothetical protein